MAKEQHSFGFQALNQARTASHALGFITGFLGLVTEYSSLNIATHPYGNLFSMVRKAMREMAIINAATVLDKQPTSTGMFQLIAEVRATRPEIKEFCNDLEERLGAHRETFTKAVIFRSNIIAHRSKQLNSREVYEKANLDMKELFEAIEVWFNVAQELSLKLRGQGFWITYDLETDAIQLLKDLAVGQLSLEN